jgi:hypothetical protein
MTGAEPEGTWRLRREAWGFAVGSSLFAVGAVPWYANAVGAIWGAATFFTGSIFFTLAAFIQLALSGRRPRRNAHRGAPAADWWSAAIQFAGTLLFNISTFAVLADAIASAGRLTAGWRPDAWGSILFLVSSVLAMIAASRRHELWDPLARTWHGTWLNLGGSVFFGISAVGAYVVPSTQSLFDEVWANLGTFLGALCFFGAAVISRRNIPADDRLHSA